MKKHNKTKFLATAFGVALVFFQLLGSTASADYRGYWIDTVRQYQAEQPSAYQPQPAYQDYGYQEPAYQPQYAPEQASRPLDVGKASYYGSQYNGHPTASGETYDMYAMTAAHRDLPFGTPIRVTNLQNGRSVVVRVNDRGPSKPGRIVDVSQAAAEQLGLILNGTADVQVDVLG
jgi:rare lipoprotein A